MEHSNDSAIVREVVEEGARGGSGRWKEKIYDYKLCLCVITCVQCWILNVCEIGKRCMMCTKILGCHFSMCECDGERRAKPYNTIQDQIIIIIYLCLFCVEPKSISEHCVFFHHLLLLFHYETVLCGVWLSLCSDAQKR